MQAAHREIAVVDDDVGVRESLTFLLETTGHRATAYGSADAFLHSGSLDRVNGLILDHHMPGMSGLDLAARLRESGWRIPILLFTSVPSPAIVMRAAALGIETVVEKPLAEADLMIFVDSLGG